MGKIEARKLSLFMPALRGGGAEKMMLHLSHEFIEQGLQVDLVLTNAVGPYLSQVPAGVRVVDLGVGRVIKSLPGLLRYLRSERPEILFSTLNQTNLVALIAKKISGLEFRLIVREANALWASVKDFPLTKRILTPYLIRQFYPSANAIIAISKGVADDLLSLGTIPRQNIHVIFNPVVNKKFIEKSKEELKLFRFCDTDVPMVLGVGRFDLQKDFPTLIRAFRLVRNKQKAKLIILGEGSQRPVLEILVNQLGLEEDVHLPGFQGNPLPYMKNASVFVSSSRYEGFGNVIVEALAVGTPVVATHCPSGPAEILDHGRYGALVPIGNPELMAAAIENSLESPPPRQALINRGMEFNIQRATEHYLEVLLGRNEKNTLYHLDA